MGLVKIKNDMREINLIISNVKAFIKSGDYSQCEEYIGKAMAKYPHSPVPHNLMGILYEKQNNHDNAMKHFRAAWDLDYSYLPARYNIENFGDFFSNNNKYIYDESDITMENKEEVLKVDYDNHGIGHVVRKK